MTTPSTTTPQSLRPAAHYTAESTWLNDPNGLVFYEGEYHLFFQNNPSGSTWGNIAWGHAVSTDLLSWEHRPVAIPEEDGEMAFSGSVVVDHRNTAGFASGERPALVAIYTAARHGTDDDPGSQAQALAFSTDGGAVWTRYAGNPVLDIGSSEFRDPKVFWHGDGDGGHWVMVVADPVEHRIGFYTSPNLIDWALASHFGPAHAVGGVWECPDLFPLRIRGTNETRWVLVVSLNPGAIAGGSGTQYFIGDFDGRVFTAERLSDSLDPSDYDWLDFGRDYYAAVSFSNVPDGRRLMIGWASNWEYANETPTGPWRSAMSLAREIELVRATDGRVHVVQAPVLPGDEVTRFEVTVPCTDGVRTTLTLTPETTTDERFVISVDGSERRISCDRTSSGNTTFHPTYPSVDWAALPADTGSSVELTIIVDAYLIEVFVGDGRVTFTEQVFPQAPFSRLHRGDIDERD
ncbi:glycoside hydrolase family 32 protein [Plantibacter sp. T3]|uniref:glycoside hydrolase family 32 protein n=1 Tax=Plantibacter sp. T3 TaxID=2653161 RepID=UPI0012F46F70|nr:glycoside hydrolase family 32 protein [Plantibacter sp. T3]VXC50152.1 Levanase [Plantibacter sp. T3]